MSSWAAGGRRAGGSGVVAIAGQDVLPPDSQAKLVTPGGNLGLHVGRDRDLEPGAESGSGPRDTACAGPSHLGRQAHPDAAVRICEIRTVDRLLDRLPLSPGND